MSTASVIYAEFYIYGIISEGLRFHSALHDVTIAIKSSFIFYFEVA
jgi:hypothetical protein